MKVVLKTLKVIITVIFAISIVVMFIDGYTGVIIFTHAVWMTIAYNILKFILKRKD